jgi:hypothetical protein
MFLTLAKHQENLELSRRSWLGRLRITHPADGSFFHGPLRRAISAKRDSFVLGFTSVIVKLLSRMEAGPRNPQNVAGFPSRS